MDISKASDIELKARIYDLSIMINRIQNEINTITNELNNREVQKNSMPFPEKEKNKK